MNKETAKKKPIYVYWWDENDRRAVRERLLEVSDRGCEFDQGWMPADKCFFTARMARKMGNISKAELNQRERQNLQRLIYPVLRRLESLPAKFKKMFEMDEGGWL